MAANLSGMFAQLNQVIGQNPLANGGVGDRLLNQTGASFGGLMGNLSQRITPKTPADPYSFMTQPAKQVAGKRALANFDLSTPQGMKQAATTYQKMGNMDAALAMAQKAKGMEEEQMLKSMSKLDLNTSQGLAQAAKMYQQMGRVDKALELTDAARARAEAEKAKEMAVLEAGQEGMQERLAQTQARAQRFRTAAFATKQGDPEMAQAIKDGVMTPESYMEMTKDKADTFQLSPGSQVRDWKNRLLAENPDDDARMPGQPAEGYDYSVGEFKAANTAITDSYTYASSESQLGGLAQRLEAMPESEFGAGALKTIEQVGQTFLGDRGADEYLQTELDRARNLIAIGMLPPGPASDKDVAIVMKGVPPANAGKEEMLEFLGAQSRIAARGKQFERMRADYILSGRLGQFQDAWAAEMEKVAQQERKQETPVGAIEKLKANPTQDMKDFFKAKYGWLPDNV